MQLKDLKSNNFLLFSPEEKLNFVLNLYNTVNEENIIAISKIKVAKVGKVAISKVKTKKGKGKGKGKEKALPITEEQLKMLKSLGLLK